MGFEKVKYNYWQSYLYIDNEKIEFYMDIVFKYWFFIKDNGEFENNIFFYKLVECLESNIIIKF